MAVTFDFDEKTLSVRISTPDADWTWAEAYAPSFTADEGCFRFSDAVSITHAAFESGVGTGVRSRFEGFRAGGATVPYAFETIIWVEHAAQSVHFEWIPLVETGLTVRKVFWPGPMAFDEARPDWYTLLTQRQGLLIPNTWPVAMGEPLFGGLFGTAGGYMPWFAQVKGEAACLTVCTTPWNAAWRCEHPAGGPHTHVGLCFTDSLGSMSTRRSAECHFLRGGYNEICKHYRMLARERGMLRTLEEKAAALPGIRRLAGSAFVHTGAKTQVQPNSGFYQPGRPERNRKLATFAQRAREVEEWSRLGVEKLYLHLDGWAQPGYDNGHPDYLPACDEAGGWEGLKLLADTLHRHGYLLGLHDQYRDYYRSAPSFDEEFACRAEDGSVPGHSRWAGGAQTYLCTTQAPYYVRRNQRQVREHGVAPDCMYLDVFTCNEGDECHNPRHRMTRRESYRRRNECFACLSAHGVLPSSEEVNEWAVPQLVFCHYAPYDFMLEEPGAPRQGVPVPLWSLVYHDCVIAPWMMDVLGGEDLMLYALLNGGAPYLVREGAYPNVDGSFTSEREFTKAEQARRCAVVCRLHEAVALREMVRHDFIGGDVSRQSAEFADGTRVEINLRTGEYQINR